MRMLLILSVIAALITGLAWNVSLLIDGVIALATGPLFDRQSMWIGWLIILLAVTAVVIWLAGRKAAQQLDRDFPDEHSGIGAADSETMNRQNGRGW